jgi:transcriptional regulator with XRE-family HTH domain
MKKDTEVKLYMQARRKGLTQRQAAARAGMSERTARQYERAGKLPSQLKRPHIWPVGVFLTKKYDVPYNYGWVLDEEALEAV